jgi:hypothetical protein
MGMSRKYAQHVIASKESEWIAYYIRNVLSEGSMGVYK